MIGSIWYQQSVPLHWWTNSIKSFFEVPKRRGIPRLLIRVLLHQDIVISSGPHCLLSNHYEGCTSAWIWAIVGRDLKRTGQPANSFRNSKNKCLYRCGRGIRQYVQTWFWLLQLCVLLQYVALALHIFLPGLKVDCRPGFPKWLSLHSWFCRGCVMSRAE